MFQSRPLGPPFRTLLTANAMPTATSRYQEKKGPIVKVVVVGEP